MNRKDIEAVLARVPGLNEYGVGQSREDRRLSEKDRVEKLRTSQESLLRSETICTKVCDWLSTQKAIKSINRRRSSYGIKHIAEQAIDEYIANGAFIAAAIHCGFPYRIDPGSPNVCFGISEKSLRAAEARKS